jgi:hypothetical protein
MRIVTARADLPGTRRRRIAMAGPSVRGTGIRGVFGTLSSETGHRCLTDRASAAATCLAAHYPAFLRNEASASCMRLLDSTPGDAS